MFPICARQNGNVYRQGSGNGRFMSPDVNNVTRDNNRFQSIPRNVHGQVINQRINWNQTQDQDPRWHWQVAPSQGFVAGRGVANHCESVVMTDKEKQECIDLMQSWLCMETLWNLEDVTTNQ